MMFMTAQAILLLGLLAVAVGGGTRSQVSVIAARWRRSWPRRSPQVSILAATCWAQSPLGWL